MRSGVTLAILRSEVLIEAGMSIESNHATQMAPRITQMLARTQRLLLREYDWPTIAGYEQTVTVAANASTGTLPSDIDFTSINSVHVSFGDEWLPVMYGIGAAERTIYNSTQRSIPIRKWEIVTGGNTFEVWPIGGDAQNLLFQGSKALGALASDSDTCTLDADVLVLRVAAELLGRDRKEDAAVKLQQARALAEGIVKRQRQSRATPIPQGRGSNHPMLRPGIDYIPPSS
jgi:hypothetical protein